MADKRLGGLAVSLLVILASAQDGCDGNQVCTNSITPGCQIDCSKSFAEIGGATGACYVLWELILSDPGLCDAANPDPATAKMSRVAECGDYNVLQTAGEAGEDICYYDRASGSLKAEIVGGHSQPFLSCAGSPAGVFHPPDCSTATFVPTPLCSPDGGVDGP